MVKETTLPICQRRLYAPMASCLDPQSWRLSFNLKVWPDGNIPGKEIIGIVTPLDYYSGWNCSPNRLQLLTNWVRKCAETWKHKRNTYTISFSAPFVVSMLDNGKMETCVRWSKLYRCGKEQNVHKMNFFQPLWPRLQASSTTHFTVYQRLVEKTIFDLIHVTVLHMAFVKQS